MSKVMRLFCAFGRHRPAGNVVLNEGREFSRCRDCGIDLVRSGTSWRPPPSGYRVVWKRFEEEAVQTAPDETLSGKPEGASLSPEPEDAEFEELPQRRRKSERRVNGGGELPAKLAGKERRRPRDRRRGFGKRPDQGP